MIAIIIIIGIAAALAAFYAGFIIGVEYGTGTVAELFEDRRRQLQAAIDANGQRVLDA